jgi:hypothetical protein
MKPAMINKRERRKRLTMALQIDEFRCRSECV